MREEVAAPGAQLFPVWGHSTADGPDATGRAAFGSPRTNSIGYFMNSLPKFQVRRNPWRLVECATGKVFTDLWEVDSWRDVDYSGPLRLVGKQVFHTVTTPDHGKISADVEYFDD